MFNKNEDYKAAFAEKAAELIALKIEDRKERMTAIENLIDQYVDSIGERPEALQLSELTNYILKEELTDKNPHKMKHGNTIASKTQLSRRRKKEKPMDFVERKLTSDRRIKTDNKRWTSELL